ncbi:MAG: hypothetical protein KFW09_03250 [Oscillospiraceae bacterium]|nr:hypothetical protein [Oscillospiraceae bacterium]
MKKSTIYTGLYKNISNITSNFQYFQKSNMMIIPFTQNRIKHIDKVDIKFHMIDYSINNNSIYQKQSNVLYIFGYLETEIEYTNISFDETIHRVYFKQYISKYIRLHNKSSLYQCVFPNIKIYDNYCNLLKNNVIYNNILLLVSII